MIADFDHPIGGLIDIGSVSDGHHSKGLGLDPDGKRLYPSRARSVPAGSSPSDVAYDRASGRVIVGASSGLCARDPETLQLEQSLLGTYLGSGSVDAWENQPTVDGELWLPRASTIHQIDPVT